MNRIPVNPWEWSLKLGYNQAEIITDTTRQLICAGQTAVDGDGTPQHVGDMRGQIEAAVEQYAAAVHDRSFPGADNLYVFKD